MPKVCFVRPRYWLWLTAGMQWKSRAVEMHSTVSWEYCYQWCKNHGHPLLDIMSVCLTALPLCKDLFNWFWYFCRHLASQTSSGTGVPHVTSTKESRLLRALHCNLSVFHDTPQSLYVLRKQLFLVIHNLQPAILMTLVIFSLSCFFPNCLEQRFKII